MRVSGGRRGIIEVGGNVQEKIGSGCLGWCFIISARWWLNVTMTFDRSQRIAQKDEVLPFEEIVLQRVASFPSKGRFLQLFPWAGLSLTSCVGGPVRVGYFPIIKGEEVVLNIFTQEPRLMHLFLSIYSCPPLPICIFIHFTLRGSFRGWVW